MDNRVRKEQFQATKDAKARGMASNEKNVFVDQRLAEYKKVELIRRAVNDVKKRGQDLDNKRKMKGKAYEGVKSKIARNIKIIDHVNKVEFGYIPPHKQSPSKR